MIAFFLIGRLVLGVYFLFNAYHHFSDSSRMAAYAGSKGVPQPRLAVLAAGLPLLVAGVSFLTGLYPVVGVAAAALFFIPVTFTMHAFWKLTDPAERAGQQINFAKNLALLGAILMFLVIQTPWPLSLG